MVAKSYQNLPIIKEPYTVNGRMYVQVKTKKGTVKQVRWYNDSQYQKMYGETPDHSNDPFWKSQKEVLGFTQDYITIFKGNTYSHKDWFKEQGARYTRHWGWGFASGAEPKEIPEDVEAIRLDWDLVGDGEKLKNESAVQAAVESLMYEPSPSQFQGNIGDRLLLNLTVVKAIPLDGYYGKSTMHVMEDEIGNIFTWTTGARTWEVGSNHTIRGTIKNHKIFKGVNQSVLTRCSEVKKEV